MIFGQGSSTSANRAKELQSSYLQKIKQAAQKVAPVKQGRSIIAAENPVTAAPQEEEAEKLAGEGVIVI